MKIKFFSLVSAVFSEGLSLVSYKAKPTDKKFKRLLFPLVLITVIILSVGFLSYSLIETLAENGQAELVPMYLILLLSFITLFEGIYKVPSTLFECRDNDLLLSLPIPKYKIFTIRVAKLILFQIIYNALFMLPAFTSYIVIVHPDLNFYLFSALMLVLTPLIPTAIAVVLGYLVKALSINFKHRKLSQTILTFVAIFASMLVVGNWQGIVTLFADYSATVSDLIGKVYYPAGAYSRLISAPTLGDLLGLLAATILPLAIIIYLCSIKYFKIISKNSATTFENSTTKTLADGKLKNLKATPKTLALVKKELSRFFASPVFIVNTLFGPILLLFVTIIAGVNIDGLLGAFGNGEEGLNLTLDDVNLLAPLFYIGGLVIMCTMTSITSSMISIEGKSFSITKSLPVSPKRILNGKLLASLALALPLFILSDFCFIFEFRPSLPYALLILILPVLVLTLIGIIGLLVNLKYPKLSATDDAEVVKQSASSLISVFIGIGVGIGSVALLVALAVLTNLDASLILTGAYLLADLFLLKLLHTKGAKKFAEIEV